MKRSLETSIRKDLDDKIVLLSGPRQVGKTTLAKSLYSKNAEYFNIDNEEHRLLVQKKTWRRDCELVIFDELHKLKHWKRWIKGVYDTEGTKPRLLVTGSARLDIFRKGGDSLAGRFYSYRLHPISVAEAKEEVEPEVALERILLNGGFPEPFIKANPTYTKRWRRSHADRILREDLLDIASVRDIRGMQTLIELLRQSVGSNISYESLARDLHISPHTVKHWIGMLESLFILFVVTPYSHNIARSLLKAPKIYFYDTGFIKDDMGARFENVVACALLKRLHYLEDVHGEKCGLYYLRDKEKREVDFLTLRDGKPEFLIEAKVSRPETSHMKHFSIFLRGQVEPIILVKNLKRELSLDKIKIKKASSWLAALEA